MMKTPSRILLIAVAMLTVFAAGAQRRVTPVEPPRQAASKRPESAGPDRSRLVHAHDADGNVILIDTITGTEVRDTLPTKIPKMVYPLAYKVTVGANIWDLAMRCLKQQYGLGGVWVEFNMHNRYMAYLEGGLGTSDISSDDTNYVFKTSLSPYFKIGAGYNLFYNSNPGYQFIFGLRYGFTPFHFRVKGTIDDTYWGEATPIDFSSQSATAGFFEITAGVRVKIVSNFSMGWNFIYHRVIHESRCSYGKPMYIPGFGKRGANFTADLSLIWNFNLNQPASAEVLNKKEN